MGGAPTDKVIEIMHISLDQVVESKVVEHFGVTDMMRALMVLGLLPAPAAMIAKREG